MRLARPLLLAASLALAAVAADADWLLLRDGTRLETEGTWEVRGRQVVFHGKDGRLSSLRLDQVDLAASQEATRAAAAPSTEQADQSTGGGQAADGASRPPVKQWTNAEIRRVGAGPGVTPVVRPSGAETEESADGEPEAPSTVVVANWESALDEDGAGLIVRGTLTNPTADRVAAAIRLTVVLFDAGGELVGRVLADTEPSTLVAGAGGEFVARFPEVHTYGAIRFDLTSSTLGQADQAELPDEP